MLPIGLACGVLRYGNSAMNVLRWLPGILLLLPWLLAPVAPANETRIRELAAPYAFRLLDWETVQLSQRGLRLWAGLFGPSIVQPADADVLRTYFDARARPPAQRAQVEAALERMVGQAYQAGGLTRSEPLPLNRLFPP